MSRWTQLDEVRAYLASLRRLSYDPLLQDEYRLPEGMQRVGYDADSGKYYYRDQDGSLWEGPEGAQFGELKQGNEYHVHCL